MIRVLFALALILNATFGFAASTTTPVPNSGNSKFYSLHNEYVSIANAGTARLVFLGDSITRGWIPRLLSSLFPVAYKPTQFGIGGDRIENILWRAINGEFPFSFQPQVVVLQAGTNNMGANSDAQIVEGTKKLASEVQRRTRKHVLIVGLFPRPDSQTWQNKRVAAINSALRSWDNSNGYWISFIDIRSSFLVNGRRNDSLFNGSVHLNDAGYRAWASGIRGTLNQLM
jgi:lysophospholipase L1-like esterase